MGLTMEALQALGKNYILITAVTSWITAQIIKTLLTLIITKKFEAERLFGAGGMPSAHSALVCSMTLSVARKVGVDSPLFALAIMFAAVVMYDAMGVRRAAGEQAKVINKIVISFKPSGEEAVGNTAAHAKQKVSRHDKNKMIKLDDQQFKKLKEYLGHTPLEVLGGALLGIMISLIVPMS